MLGGMCVVWTLKQILRYLLNNESYTIDGRSSYVFGSAIVVIECLRMEGQLAGLQMTPRWLICCYASKNEEEEAE